MKSVWEYKKLNYPKLSEDIERDIVIIGGGIAGMLCAYQLTNSGYKVTLVESNELLSGVTKYTTAKISSLQGLLYRKLKKSYNIDFAKNYFKSQEEAIKQYEELVEKYKIDCHFQKVKAYIYSKKQNNNIEDEYNTLIEMGVNAQLHNKLENLPFIITKAVSLENQAQFDPLLFLYGLPRNYEIYEHTLVTKITDNYVYTDKHKIKANTIIQTTHYPIKNFPGMYLFKMYQSSSYLLAVKNNVNVDGIYLEDINDGISLRNYKDYLLIGGGDHRTGRSKTDDSYTKLNLVADKLFKASDDDEKIQWNNQDCITFDGIPYVGLFSKSTPNLYVVTGFNKWGMTNAMVSSNIIRDLIIGNKNEYEYIFSTHRNRILKHLDLFLVNSIIDTKSLIKQKLCIPFKTEKSLNPGEAGIVLYKGKKHAVYKDEDGQIYAINSKCGHFHCEIKWNPNTKIWECPCHGSRYDIYGNIINGPASKTL